MVETCGIICGIIFIFSMLYYYYTSIYDFWKKRGVPEPEPTTFFRMIKDILKKTSIDDYIIEIYKTYKDEPFIGIFSYFKPLLIIKDPEIFKDVMITDSAIFSERGVDYFKKIDPVWDNMFFVKGDVAKRMRTQLSPSFSPAKLKEAFPLIIRRSEKFLKERFDPLLLKNGQINCSVLLERYVGDLSCISMFGYDINTMRDREDELYYYMHRFFYLHWQNKIRLLLSKSRLYNLIGYFLDGSKVKKIFLRFATDVLRYRRENNIIRNDIANMLMKQNQNHEKLPEEDELTNEFRMLHIPLLLIAAYDTTSTVLGNTLYELAFNHNVQDRLREQIQNIYTKNNGEIKFEDVNSMSYLDAVFKEVMRKYPLMKTMQRRASQAYTFKNSKINIPKDQIICIPMYAILHDPTIYAQPEVFDPERFIGEFARSRPPMHSMTFGYGSRNCIGERLGLLQYKVIIISILRNYKVDICEKTMVPYISQAEVLIHRARNIYLKITKIT